MRKGLLAGIGILSCVLMAGTLASSASAVGQACEWVGTAGDNTFSTAGNWTNCNSGAPGDGDSIVFLEAIPTNEQGWAILNIDNDSNPELAGVTTNMAIPEGTYGAGTVYLSSLTLADGASYQETSGSVVIGQAQNGETYDIIGGPIVINGDFTYDDSLMREASSIHINGTLTVNGVDGQSSSFSYRPDVDSVQRLVVNSSSVSFDSSATNNTVNIPIDFGNNVETVLFGSIHDDVVSANWAVSGALTIAPTKLMVCVAGGDSVSLTGTGAVASKISSINGCMGELSVGSQVVEAQARQIDIKGDAYKDETLYLNDKETGVMTQGSTTKMIYVGEGGLLKGVGVVTGQLYVASEGRVAPGMSPGCIEAGTMTLYGDYTFELGGTTPCAEYDQIKITNATIASPLTLDASYATLTTSRYNDYTPKQGDTFTIIDQIGTVAVKGTFKGLAEGSTFEQNGVLFKITYKGGGGNDVVLTVMNEPATPNTGFAIIKSSPLVVLVATIVGAASLVLIARHARARR